LLDFRFRPRSESAREPAEAAAVVESGTDRRRSLESCSRPETVKVTRVATFATSAILVQRGLDDNL